MPPFCRLPWSFPQEPKLSVKSDENEGFEKRGDATIAIVPRVEGILFLPLALSWGLLPG